MTSRNSYMRNYYNTNLSYKEQCKLKSKERYLKLKEKGIKQQLTEAQKEVKRLRDAEYKQKHKEQLKEKKKNYYKSDIGKLNQKCAKQRQRARKYGHKTTTNDIRKLLLQAQDKCYWCKSKLNNNYHIDHYVPLSKGGTNEITNLVISCPKCNLEKNAKDPYLFAITKGSLF